MSYFFLNWDSVDTRRSSHYKDMKLQEMIEDKQKRVENQIRKSPKMAVAQCLINKDVRKTSFRQRFKSLATRGENLSIWATVSHFGMVTEKSFNLLE